MEEILLRGIDAGGDRASRRKLRPPKPHVYESGDFVICGALHLDRELLRQLLERENKCVLVVGRMGSNAYLRSLVDYIRRTQESMGEKGAKKIGFVQTGDAADRLPLDSLDFVVCSSKTYLGQKESSPAQGVSGKYDLVVKDVESVKEKGQICEKAAACGEGERWTVFCSGLGVIEKSSDMAKTKEALPAAKRVVAVWHDARLKMERRSVHSMDAYVHRNVRRLQHEFLFCGEEHMKTETLCIKLEHSSVGVPCVILVDDAKKQDVPGILERLGRVRGIEGRATSSASEYVGAEEKWILVSTHSEVTKRFLDRAGKEHLRNLEALKGKTRTLFMYDLSREKAKIADLYKISPLIISLYSTREMAKIKKLALFLEDAGISVEEGIKSLVERV